MKRDEDEMLDLAYELFLEVASDNLSAKNIEIFNEEFSDFGVLEMVQTQNNFEEEIGVLIDPSFYAQINIALMKADIIEHIFAKVLIPYDADCDDFHLIW